MIEALKRLLSPEYLVVTEPGAMGSLWLLYLALGMLFSTGLVIALRMLLGAGKTGRTAGQRAWAWFEVWICLAGLGAVVGRFCGWPGWSARVWPYSLAALAIVGALACRFRRQRLPLWLAAQLRVLALTPSPHSNAPPRATGAPAIWFIAGLFVHLTGIAILVRVRYGWPVWASLVVLLAILTPQAPLLIRRRPPRLMALTPLLGAYAVVLLWLLYRWLGITIIGWQGLAFPNPMSSLFYVDGIVLAAIAYAVLCQLGITADQLRKPAILWRWAVLSLLAATLVWAGVVYFTKRTHGATASDPYAYAQMGVDLAERHTLLHRLSLFEAVMPLDIAWAPLQPVGYRIPRNELGDSPSVWATGASVLLAAGYRFLGEVGLYVTTPIVALLALAATWALVQEALQGKPRSLRYLTGALTLALLATSPEHVDRLLVPMADAPAQLFTVLTLLFALRTMHQMESGRGVVPGDSLMGRLLAAPWSLLMAGIFFAWAYWVRHTQLVLALPVALALLPVGWTTKPKPIPENPAQGDGRTHAVRRWLQIAVPFFVFLGVALIAALPDILYRWRVFGGLLASETTELPLMHLQHIGPVAWQMARDALAAGEWGYLFPLALYGSYRLIHDRRREMAVLACAFAAVLLVHLTYRSLRLRDLLSLFPLLDLAVAYGAVTLVHKVRRMSPGVEKATRLGISLLPPVVIAWVVLSLALSRWAMADRLWKPGWASFGYMRVEQRAAFHRLAELTPPEGIIGASLNAGAVMMYTGRDAIRPYDSWTVEEWDIFVGAMRAAGRPIYLLDDGGLMAEFVEADHARHLLTPIEELEIPVFYSQGRQTGWLYRLEWDQ